MSARDGAQRLGTERLGTERLGTERLGTERLGTERQPIVKAAGKARRARLLPAPDTDPNPHPPVLREEGGVAHTGSAPSANEAQLRQDRPPHW